EALLKDADITINGSRPWDPQIHSDKVWSRIYAQGTLGLGEAYMDGLWDVADMPEFFNKVLRSKAPEAIRPTFNLIWQIAQARLLNMQDVARSKRVANMHYNQTEAYKASLDNRM